MAIYQNYRDLPNFHTSTKDTRWTLWAFAYDVNNETEKKRLACKPVYGEVGKFRGSRLQFIPYKKNSKELKSISSAVDVYARIYADTEAEAIEAYNKLVQERINNLHDMIKSATDDFV